MSIVKKLGIVISPMSLKFANNVLVFYWAIEEENFSTIGYAKLNVSLKIDERMDKPTIVRDFDYENKE